MVGVLFQYIWAECIHSLCLRFSGSWLDTLSRAIPYSLGVGCVCSLLPCRNPLHCSCNFLLFGFHVLGVLVGPLLVVLVVTLQLAKAHIGVVNTFDGTLELAKAVFQPVDNDGRRVCLQSLQGIIQGLFLVSHMSLPRPQRVGELPLVHCCLSHHWDFPLPAMECGLARDSWINEILTCKSVFRRQHL